MREMREIKKIQTAYFVGDVHMDSRIPEREAAFCRFLDKMISEKPDVIFFLGDLFDFWFGYRTVMFTEPIKTIARISALKEAGVDIIYIVGNHDFNPGPLFSSTLGIPIVYEPITVDIEGRKVYLSHGDEINSLDKGYRFIKAILRNKISQTLFKFIPASWAWHIGKYTSEASRNYTKHKADIPEHIYEEFFLKCANQNIDVVIHGHTHEPVCKTVSAGGNEILFINSGHWFNPGYYVEYKNKEFKLKTFEI